MESYEPQENGPEAFVEQFVSVPRKQERISLRRIKTILGEQYEIR